MLPEADITSPADAITDRPVNFNLYATQYNRQLLHVNGMLEVLGSGLSELTLAAIIPTKMAQTVFSGIGFFSTQLKPRDRIGHGIQASLALTQMVCVITLYMKGNECNAEDEYLCKALILAGLMYQASHLVGFIYEDVFKKTKHHLTNNIAINRLRDVFASFSPTPSVSSSNDSFFTANEGISSVASNESADANDKKPDASCMV